MNKERTDRITAALEVLFFSIFAMPFYGAYMMLDKGTESKVIGATLCIVGLVIWFLVGLN